MKVKADKKSDLDRLNDLIDWYEANKPDAGREIPLSVTPYNLARMFGIKKNGIIDPVEFVMHRGRKILATVLDKLSPGVKP